MVYSREKIMNALGNHRDTVNIIIKDLTASTNDIGKETVLSGEKKNTLILAYRQDKGRGRLGRSFFSPEGGIYMSLAIPEIRLPAEEMPLITPAAAVALTRAIEKLTPAEPAVKWVNDIFIRGGKAAGILTETVFTADGFFPVVGIGVNLLPPEGGFPSDLKGIAESVYREEEDIPEDIMSVLAGTVTKELLDLIKLIPERGFSEEYRRRSFVIGKNVSVIQNGVSTEALVTSIDDNCRLGVRYRDGREEYLFGGEISLRI